eukprot:gene5253-3754_t
MDGVKNFTRPMDNYLPPKIDKLGAVVPYVTKDLTLYTVPLGLKSVGLESCRHFAYIGETPQIPGKFFLEKALELGVPKGPTFEPTLSQYFSIIPSIASTESTVLQALMDEAAFQSFRSSEKLLQVMVHLSSSVVVQSAKYMQWIASFGPATKHIFVGPGMAKDSAHTSYVAERLYSQKLASLYPSMFPTLLSPDAAVPTDLTSMATVFADEQLIHGEAMLKYNILPLKRAGLDLSEALSTPSETDTQTMLAEFEASLESSLVTRAHDYRQQMTSAIQNDTNVDNVRFYFLGTGCAIPSKYRNVSSTLLYFHGSQAAMLLDCGEGSWHQLQRLSPPTLTEPTTAIQRAQEWSRLIQLVWISHLHADHHLGLIHLIVQRKLHLPADVFRPLFIIAPMFVLRFLEEVAVMMPEIADAFVGIPSNCFDPTDLLCTECVTEDGVIAQLQRNTIDSTIEASGSSSSDPEEEEVHAAPSTNGLVLTIRKTTSCGMASSATTEHNPDEGVEVEDPSLLKIVYSGDTRPSETLILWGQDAHILLHEATFEDDKCMEAVQKKHSTINEAVEVARLMRTPHLILTHFSQRYHGIPMQFHPQYPLLLQQQQLMEAKATAVEQGTSVADVSVATPVLQTTPVTATTDVVVAFDFMTVSDRELTWAKGLTPLLAEIFPALPVPGEEEDEDLLGKEEAAAAAAATGRNQG